MRFIGNAPVDGEVRAIASGALATGDTVIVNSDGTVSVVAGSGSPESIGTPASFTTSRAQYPATVFDSNSSKVVASYRDHGNSNYGTAVVGTVSGQTISWGTPVVFNSSRSEFQSASFDSNSNKVVIAYRDEGGNDSDKGYAVVGTVSGASISFGSPAQFNSGRTTWTSIDFDSSQNKFLISYSDLSNGTYGTCVVATVSGTSISFGSETVFNSSSSNTPVTVFDSSANKFLVAYEDVGGGSARVATISGTSVSFGAEVAFESDGIGSLTGAFASSVNKIALAYVNTTDGFKGYARLGTISGTSVSFGSASIFDSEKVNSLSSAFDGSSNKFVIFYGYDTGGGVYYTRVVNGAVSGASISFDTPLLVAETAPEETSTVFDSSAEKVVSVYIDGGSSGYATAVVYQSNSLVTNLTSENFVGFANSGYADGQSAALNSTCSVDKNQSGLTAGETYYVQIDGTLGTTPADPSVLAGTAISSNSIIVKG